MDSPGFLVVRYLVTQLEVQPPVLRGQFLVRRLDCEPSRRSGRMARSEGGRKRRGGAQVSSPSINEAQTPTLRSAYL